MTEKGETLDIAIAPVTLADYSVVRQSIVLKTENEEPAPRRSDIKVSLLELIRMEPNPDAEDDEPAQYSSVVSVAVDPTEDSNYYRSEIAITGLFVVLDGNYDDESAERFVAERGTQELYDIARVQLAQATTSCLFGTLMLPSIEVASVDDERK